MLLQVCLTCPITREAAEAQVAKFPHLLEIKEALYADIGPGEFTAMPAFWPHEVACLDKLCLSISSGRNVPELEVFKLDAVQIRPFLDAVWDMDFREQLMYTQAFYVVAAHRLLRQAARPKILLARDFETACRLYRRYQGSLMGAISDVRFPVRGVPNPAAGLDFIRMVRANDADLPLVLQSSSAEIEPLAHALGAGFIHKHSPTLLGDLRGFMLNSLGFGDFVFRDAHGREIDRAVDIRDLARKLGTIPDSSLLSHGGRSHFSNWLKARTEFALAARVREIRVDESADADRLRDELELALGDFLVESQKDVVAEAVTAAVARPTNRRRVAMSTQPAVAMIAASRTRCIMYSW